MAKFFYRCVHQVDMAYMAPWGKGGDHSDNDSPDAPLLVRHFIRVLPARKGLNSRGIPFKPMYICTDKPLAKHFPEQIVKKVSRPAFDPLTGRKLPQRAYRKKITKVKFELVPTNEVTEYISDYAIYRPGKGTWAPEMFEETSSVVELPIDPELEKRIAMMGPDEEPTEGEEMVRPEGQVVRGRK
jgi:hypothetical protein